MITIQHSIDILRCCDRILYVYACVYRGRCLQLHRLLVFASRGPKSMGSVNELRSRNNPSRGSEDQNHQKLKLNKRALTSGEFGP